MTRAIVLLVVLAQSGSSASLIQCALVCAQSLAATEATDHHAATSIATHHHGGTLEGTHRHGERDHALIGIADHACSPQETTTIAVRPSSARSQTLPTLLAIAPFASNPVSPQACHATVSASPPGSPPGSCTRPFPLRI